MLKRFIERLTGAAQPVMISESARIKALDTLRKHGIAAHYYLPAAGCEDRELADVLRHFGSNGYIMTDANGAIVGKVAKATLTSEERALEARKRFFLVNQ